MRDNDLEKLIYLLSKLPGLGKRSARRAVLHLIQNKESLMSPLSESIESALKSISVCSECGNIDSVSPCNICTNPTRIPEVICVVEEVSDLWAIERSNMFKGKYHVLGGTLSAIDGRTPDDLNIANLLHKCECQQIDEIILATNATIEGQTTAHYITNLLADRDIKITQIAHGIPIGGELDYLDEGTLTTAFNARKTFGE